MSGIDSVFRRGLDSLSLRIAVTLRTLSRISTGRTLMEGESVWSTREAVVVVFLVFVVLMLGKVSSQRVEGELKDLDLDR